jgi:hypothetical protein
VGKLSVFLAAIACAIVAVPVAGAAQNASSPFPGNYGQTHDYVFGSQLTTDAATNQFQLVSIVASSDANGANPRGLVQATYQSPSLPGGSASLLADVLCINMFPPGYLIPPTAFVWAVLRTPILGYTNLQLQINDNGTPTASTPSPDTTQWLLSSTAPGADCGAWGTSMSGQSRGNYVINNAP